MIRRASWQAAMAVVVSIAVGRWLAGPGFGYAIFALVWMPIAAACFPYVGSLLRQFGVTILLAAVAMLPCFLDERPLDAGRLALIVVTWTLAVLAVRIALAAGFHVSASRSRGGQIIVAGGSRIVMPFSDLRPSAALAVIIWLTGLVVPLTRADVLAARLGDAWFGYVSAIHPLLTANAVLPTAPDWTHSALAYRYLTALGQDLPYAWPSSVWPTLAAGGAVITLSLLFHLTVATVGMFHVEQNSVSKK